MEEGRPITIRGATERFIQDIDTLQSTIPLALAAIETADKSAKAEYETFLRDHSRGTGAPGEIDPPIAPAHMMQYSKLAKRAGNTGLAHTKTLRAFVVSLVSQFDSLLGRLIRACFYLRPEKLDTVEKSIPFSQLMDFGSIDDAKEFVIESEIESVLRKSHSDQFKWLENKFDIKLREDLAVWATFVELTERRNLFVHTDGKVSNQYLSVCKQHGVDTMGIAAGTECPVNLSYFETGCACIFEIGVKLAQVLWRKHQPDALEEADTALDAVCKDLLSDEKWAVAKALLDFAVTVLKKHSSDEMRKTFIINQAQAYKWSGDEAKAKAILTGVDWSACSDKFKLSRAVLSHDFQTAAVLMRKIGAGGDFNRDDYVLSPLFGEFRQSAEFLLAFEEIFGESYSSVA
jgi:hypothetical protein